MKTLTEEVLIELGFERETFKNVDGEDVVTWYSNGITLFEDRWSNPIKYMFPSDIREDGSFKSGWIIVTDEQLLILMRVLKNEIENGNK